MLQGKAPIIYGDGNQERDYINIHESICYNLVQYIHTMV